MSKEGHIHLKRWYEPGADRDDYFDLTEYEIYYGSVNKQYKAKYLCADCGKDLGWYCYPTDRFLVMWHELSDGFLCVDCCERDNIDMIDAEDYDLCAGRLCKC